MPPTLVHMALGGLLAAALLGPAFDRRTALVVVGAAAAPDLDSVLQLLVPAAHGALLHTLFIPMGAAAVLWFDERGGGGRVRARYGARGIRTAWVALLAYALAGTGLDLFNIAAANPFYPVTDHFYAVVGKVELSNHRGLVQTFLGPRKYGWGVPRYDAGYCVPSALDTTCHHPADGDGRIVLVESGWQLLVVVSSALALGVADRRAVPAKVAESTETVPETTVGSDATASGEGDD